jgi:hypothetical protein
VKTRKRAQRRKEEEASEKQEREEGTHDEQDKLEDPKEGQGEQDKHRQRAERWWQE